MYQGVVPLQPVCRAVPVEGRLCLPERTCFLRSFTGPRQTSLLVARGVEVTWRSRTPAPATRHALCPRAGSRRRARVKDVLGLLAQGWRCGCITADRRCDVPMRRAGRVFSYLGKKVKIGWKQQEHGEGVKHCVELEHGSFPSTAWFSLLPSG